MRLLYCYCGDKIGDLMLGLLHVEYSGIKIEQESSILAL